MSDNIALIKFSQGFEPVGPGSDGLPWFAETVIITKTVHPYTQVSNRATEADFAEFPAQYEIFQKEQRARKQRPTENGFPLALWPVISEAQLLILAARDILTIEQLAKIKVNDQAIPGDIRELAERAKGMVQLSTSVGQFEVMVRERDGQIASLTEQVTELRNTIKVQDGTIAALRQKAA